jgi:hypothetical protein
MATRPRVARMRPGRYISGQPTRLKSRYADDWEKPTEAELIDEPEAPDEVPADREPDTESRWSV